MLNLLLQLLYHVVFVVAFHPTQVDMALDLHIVSLAFLDLGILRVNLELHLFVLEVVFCLDFFESALLQGDLILDLRVFIRDLLNARFTSLRPKLSFTEGLENITGDRVYVQFGFTDHADHSEVLAVVLRVKLRERKSFADTI